MEVYFTPTQAASWLDVSEKTVTRMVEDGRLEPPVIMGKRPRFLGSVILPSIVRDEGVRFAGGATLKTHAGPIYFELIKAEYKFNNFGELCAVFRALDGSWHLRSWGTAFVFDMDIQHHPSVMLSCEDCDIEEMSRRNLPPIYSAHVDFLEPFDASLMPDQSKPVLRRPEAG